jgi:phosphoribosylpyrophosphate synthetase
MLIDLLILLGYLYARHAARITIVTGYLPLARSDKDEGELELALLPHIIHLFSAAAYGKLERIVAADLHSEQAVMAGGRMALVTEVSLIRRILKKVIEKAQREHPDFPICIFFTDEGSVKRYEEPVMQICEEMEINLPKIVGRKRRTNSHKSRLEGLDGDIEAINEALVIGIDDEVATCGTNNSVAAFIKEHHRARYYWAAVVHPVLCGNAPGVLRNSEAAIDCTFAMATIPVDNRPELMDLITGGRLVVYPWKDDLASILYFLHWDTTIRSLR